MRGPSPSKDVRLPPLAAIQAFEAAARLGSFERASEELFVTASAIGKRIAALEAQLDVTLFIRSSRGITLSAAGREYLEQVRTALALLSDASLHKRGEPKPEPLRVVSTPTFARQVLIPALPGFTATHPEVELEIMLSIPYLDIMPPNADVWIRFGSGRYPGLHTRPLTADPVFAVCSPAYRDAHGPFRQPRDLARAALLRCPMEPWRPWLAAAGLDWPEPTRGVWLVDLGMMLAAARAGQGIALTRRTLAAEWLDEGKLLRVLDIETAGESQYYLCTETSRPPGGAVQAFSLWLTGVCQRAAQWPRGLAAHPE
ncbi:MAG: LysR substrate-binding domain-containing protein [Achromobacter pulmonis]|uniref:Glycine cleavage system transcriptional activator n=1 Tax=Achromobacter pulmonis TaxID=1389932 RepID=A0A6S7DBQ0_9BURK|nr:LysR substrate-binding domain-containing protein [Achromobacter pulmonis]CAB3678547.1 Glycine cleavage system transcriptional activator [Achromobacter pulmonis]CAB3887187.1 Glycine cleavage system transcriptional activator [Achromobacter pulmonis]